MSQSRPMNLILYQWICLRTHSFPFAHEFRVNYFCEAAAVVFPGVIISAKFAGMSEMAEDIVYDLGSVILDFPPR